MIPGSDRIPGNLITAESATKVLPNTRFEVSAKLKLSRLSTLAQETQPSLIRLFDDDGNWEEDGPLTVVTG